MPLVDLDLPPVLLDPAAVALGDEALPAPGGHLAHELVGEEAGPAAAAHESLENAAANLRYLMKWQWVKDYFVNTSI